MSCQRLIWCLCFGNVLVSLAGCQVDGKKNDLLGSGSHAVEGDAAVPENDGAVPDADVTETRPDSGKKKPESVDAGVEQDAAMPTLPETDAGTDAGTDAALPADPDAGTDAGTTPEEIEIAGSWHSSFGGTEVIDSNGFTSYGSTSAIIEYDNTADSMITQNPADAAYGPNKYNKIVWTELAAGSFYYCWVDFSLDTVDDARNTTMTADSSDPANGGCGGSPWTKLSPVIAVAGSWTDGVTPISIDSDTWGALSVVSYGADSAITQNPNSGGDPLEFNKVVWTAASSAGFDFCFVSMNQSSAGDAATNAGMATPSDLATGCLGAAWTHLDAQ